jgi:hypothetical protein
LTYVNAFIRPSVLDDGVNQLEAAQLAGGRQQMKRLLLAGAALLAALATVEPAAYAQRVNFGYTVNLVTYTMPTTGLCQIAAFGAQGDGSTSAIVGPGGLGAEIGGDFNLTAGEALQIAVGGVGLTGTLGGGGGSFVVGPGNNPLVIAGGGGGGGTFRDPLTNWLNELRELLPGAVAAASATVASTSSVRMRSPQI